MRGTWTSRETTSTHGEGEVGLISEIIEDLFIGDFQDVVDHGKEYVSINVAYEHKLTLPDSLYIPFLIPAMAPPVQQTTVLGFVLDAIAEIIDLQLAAGRKVLVNCNMGLERSPLAVMWFLVRKRGMTMDAAYELVKEKRPQIYDRRMWVSRLV